MLGIGSVGIISIVDGTLIGLNSINDGIVFSGPKLIWLGIGGTTDMIEGIFIFGIPISKLGNIIGGRLIIASGTWGIVISKGGKAGHSGIWINTGSGATGKVGSFALFLIVGVWTILQLFVSTLTTGSIWTDVAYKCVPVNSFVVEVPSPKSILKFL